MDTVFTWKPDLDGGVRGGCRVSRRSAGKWPGAGAEGCRVGSGGQPR